MSFSNLNLELKFQVSGQTVRFRIHLRKGSLYAPWTE